MELCDEILQFTGKYLQLCHHFSAVSQGPITEAMVHFKRFQLLRKKEASFISPSAAAMFICGDKAIVSYKHGTLRNALQQHLITSSIALAAFHSWCMNVWFQVHKAPMIGYSLCSASLHCLLNLFPPQLYHRLIFASCFTSSINYFLQAVCKVLFPILLGFGILICNFNLLYEPLFIPQHAMGNVPL